MKSQECYDNWRKEGQKVETLDQVMYVLLNEITKRALLEQVPQMFCDDEIESICSLRESFDEFVKQERGRSFEDFKCNEITPKLIESYRKFLQLKESDKDEYSLTAVHLGTIGKILYMSNERGIANWSPELLHSYESFTPILL